MQYLFNMGYKAIITEKDKSFPVFFPFMTSSMWLFNMISRTLHAHEVVHVLKYTATLPAVLVCIRK